MRCLLCGFADDKVNLVGNLPACSHCEREAKSLCTEEAHGLLLGCFIGYALIGCQREQCTTCFFVAFAHLIFGTLKVIVAGLWGDSPASFAGGCIVETGYNQTCLRSVEVWPPRRLWSPWRAAEERNSHRAASKNLSRFARLYWWFGWCGQCQELEVTCHNLQSKSTFFFFPAHFSFGFVYCLLPLETMTICKCKQISRTRMN